MVELTDAELQMIKALAAQVIMDRLARANVVGATAKGRTIIEFVGEPTAAELKWEELTQQLRSDGYVHPVEDLGVRRRSAYRKRRRDRASVQRDEPGSQRTG